MFYPFKDRRPITDRWCKAVRREGAFCIEKIDVARIELVPFHPTDQDYVGCREAVLWSANKRHFPNCKTMGQHAGEQLVERADELPREWMNDKGPILLFTDTELVGFDDQLLCPFALWLSGEWQLSWHRYDLVFNRRCHFVRLRK